MANIRWIIIKTVLFVEGKRFVFVIELSLTKYKPNESQRRAIYIAIYRLTTIIGLSGHIVVYMLNSHCKHLVKSHWYLIHAVQAGKIIVVIWFTPCKLGKLFLGFDSRRATSENYCWYSIHAVQSRKIIVGIWFTACNLGKLFLPLHL